MASLTKLIDWQPGPLVNVVFVHGLGGHPYGTWRRLRGDVTADPSFWPMWLGDGVPGAAIYSLGYASAPSGWLGQAMPFEDRTRNLAELLVTEDFAPDVPIVLIGHSLGGVLIKSVLLLMEEEAGGRPEFAAFVERVRGVIFLGTPHSGSGKASMLDRMRVLVWPSPLTRALVADAPALRRINVSYRRFASERGARLRHLVLFETRPTWLGMIVNEGSADPGLADAAPIGIDADHVDIAKPSDRGSLDYRSIEDFVQDTAGGASGLSILRPALPEFSETSGIAWPGLIARLLTLGAAVALVVFLWPQAQVFGQQQDDPQALIQLLSSIEDTQVRLSVAAQILERTLTPEEVALIGQIAYAPSAASAPVVEAVARIQGATNRADVIDAISGTDLKACSGDFRFEVDGPYLHCADGSPVPFLRSPNAGQALKSLEAIVFHFTASNNPAAELRVLTDANRNASVHLIVSRNGSIVQLVPFDLQAWHAGESVWAERSLSGLNGYSVGVSFSNAGELRRDADGTYRDWIGSPVAATEVFAVGEGASSTYWQAYSADQMAIARSLVAAFRRFKPDIGILGHAEISRGRKADPGPAFPLDDLRGVP